MADNKRESLPELVVKEAVGAGMDSPMRESIVEAVEEAEGPRRRMKLLPMLGAALGAGVGVGYLLGTQADDSVEFDTESLAIDSPEEVIDGDEDETTTETEAEADGGGRRLPKIVLLIALGGAIALARRRLRSDEDGWEPIDELETPVGESSVSTDEDTESETETETDEESEEEESVAETTGDDAEEGS